MIFLLKLFDGFLATKGRINFTQLSRYWGFHKLIFRRSNYNHIFGQAAHWTDSHTNNPPAFSMANPKVLYHNI